MSKELIELSNALAQAADRAASSVVAVHTERRGSSSGIVWRSGVIVTSEHALLGDAATLKPGSLTLGVGRTRASGPVAALGVVSLVAPDRRTWTGASIVPYIRLDVGLHPTAVGGAVIDANGRTVGLATPRFARFGAIAVPASSINKITDILLQKGRIPRGYLGVGLQPVRLPDALRDKLKWNEKTAAIVMDVHPGGSADKAGIVIGDILISMDGQPVTGLEDVQSHLAGEAIGKTLPLKFVRGGAIQAGSIVVAERPHGGE